ncbi:MAG: septum formation initiator family protein [Elusimicrobia bacterium]|nr:septum formation initiator family protein [Elusimicrobiota bacterium]
MIYIVIGVVVLTFILSSSGIRKIILLKKEIVRLEKEIEQVRQDNERISEELSWIENEDDYLEYLARKNLGLILPGEKKYYIMPESEE